MLTAKLARTRKEIFCRLQSNLFVVSLITYRSFLSIPSLQSNIIIYKSNLHCENVENSRKCLHFILKRANGAISGFRDERNLIDVRRERNKI